MVRVYVWKSISKPDGVQRRERKQEREDEWLSERITICLGSTFQEREPSGTFPTAVNQPEFRSLTGY